MGEPDYQTTPTDLEAFENKRDELMEGLLEAYEAGYKKAIEDFEMNGELPDKTAVEGSQHLSECHYYYWDGRNLPLEFWLRDHFGLDD